MFWLNYFCEKKNQFRAPEGCFSINIHKNIHQLANLTGSKAFFSFLPTFRCFLSGCFSSLKTSKTPLQPGLFAPAKLASYLTNHESAS